METASWARWLPLHNITRMLISQILDKSQPIDDKQQMAPKRETLSQSVRRLVRDCGMTQYELCHASGVDKAAMSRFMAGKSGLTLQSLDRLAVVLGWRIVAGRAKPKRR